MNVSKGSIKKFKLDLSLAIKKLLSSIFDQLELAKPSDSFMRHMIEDIAIRRPETGNDTWLDLL